MPAYDLDTQAYAIADRLAASSATLVACLCAAWCDTCHAYRTGFDALADLYPQMCFVWIDIETHADWLNTLEIENFPTLWIEDPDRVCFFGAVPPQHSILKRLLAHIKAGERIEEARNTTFRLRSRLISDL